MSDPGDLPHDPAGGQAATESGGGMPYIDLLLRRLEEGDARFVEAFGRHLHWGSWDDPGRADGSAEDFGRAAERLTDQLLAAAAIVCGERVLDAGCGLGGTLTRLDAALSGLALTGLNIDPRQLERAAALPRPHAANSLRWVCGDACAMPFAAGSFDAVLTVECIFHFPSRDAFFRESARVLRPGGRLVLCDFVPTAALRLAQRAAGLLGRGRSAVEATYGRIDCTCTLAGYRQLARRHGLRLSLNDDINRSTLPTYPVVEALFAAAGRPEAVTATRTIGRLSGWGLLRYRILRFDREGGDALPAPLQSSTGP